MRANPYYFTKHWRELRAKALVRACFRCEVPGCKRQAEVVDHIETRPAVPYPCEQDRLDNLRAICRSHDSQVKEHRRGLAARRGNFRVIGCDADGTPRDPRFNR